MQRVEYLTPEGKAHLEKRLRYLTTVRRPEVAQRLRLALQDGGELTENTEYENAKNEQAFVEAEITRLSTILRSAKLIDEASKSDAVQIGSHVIVMEKGADSEENYHIVGSAEANPRQGRISIESPLGKAMIGKKVGEKVTVVAPDGDIIFVIQEIK